MRGKAPRLVLRDCTGIPSFGPTVDVAAVRAQWTGCVAQSHAQCPNSLHRKQALGRPPGGLAPPPCSPQGRERGRKRGFRLQRSLL